MTLEMSSRLTEATEFFPSFLTPVLLTGSRKREVARWTNVGGPIPTGGRPSYSSSEVPITRINNQGKVKRIRKISDSPTNPDAESSDEFDGEEVEVTNLVVFHPSRYSPTQPPSKKFHSYLITSTPRSFQPFLSSVPPSSPKSSTSRSILASPMKPSPIPQPRPSPLHTSHQLRPVASISQIGEDQSPFPFPASKIF
ncbi:hypothetical protein O181_031379 [Austropuccinia psidii MF-1]|uniref:Uncharacterized protein n=1 Tax=Austropuccinia psidii MF-1 TaxID=1389203 RepID=A0A9Q3H6H0_9BASI|nr:hypothetical protein [Austropuccinia psidii MF-1]